ncbi:MAG: bifunctional serine/threonine-protein kinase/formylglycine-generating enzyme family protein [Planctomycetaceae bacterium]
MPQHPAQPIDPAVRAGDAPSVASAEQATPSVHDWQSQPDPRTYLARVQSELLTVQVGTLVAQRYEVVEELGEGGMGLVFRVKDRKVRRDLVLKFIRPDLVHQPGMVERLSAEADAAAALNHPHVVTLHNRESDPHGEFLVMEFVDGPNLLQLLQQTGGKLSVERAVRYIGQVGSALQAAHDAGILHRDVKPSNVLINRSDVAKLADFGLARIVEDSGLTKSGAVMGTLDYMAPEQSRDARLVSPQSDQFSLAKVLYQLVTGHPANQIWGEDIPDSLREVLRRALAANPPSRFPSVAEFVQALPGPGVVATASRLSPVVARIDHEQPTDLAKEFARLHAAAQQQSVEARQAFEQHDYARAAKICGKIPEELRDDEFLRDVIAKRDRVIELDRQIREAHAAMKLSVLRPAVDELLQLQPDRPDMQELQAQIARLILSRPETKPLPRSPEIPTKPGQRTTFTLNGIEYAFRWCPAGKFRMGDALVEVELTRGYWMQETLVTQGMWQSVMGSGLDWKSYGNGPRHPVYNVSHDEAVKFCETLNGAMKSAGVGGLTVRLPSEAEWESAYRAGTQTRFYWGDDESKLGEYAWHKGNSNGGTHPVGEKKANGWGLFDMSGNVWEWCGDWYADNLVGGRDPQGASSGSLRSDRGGCWWSSEARWFSAAFRSWLTPSYRSNYVGFRLAAVPAGR